MFTPSPTAWVGSRGVCARGAEPGSMLLTWGFLYETKTPTMETQGGREVGRSSY